jgi:hypothetical protein
MSLIRSAVILTLLFVIPAILVGSVPPHLEAEVKTDGTEQPEPGIVDEFTHL